jgi:hypothetical protein
LITETAERIRPPHALAHDFDHAERMYNDTTTWLAEVMDGQMRTPFEYSFDGRELYGKDGGALKPIFETAIVDADRIARNDPSLAFEARRRRTEKGEYLDMLAMERGELPNTMVVVSDFPKELMNAPKDQGGYNTTRKQTMLRVIYKQPNGNLAMVSQSLDMSDRKALEAIYDYMGYKAQPGELLGQRINVDMQPKQQEFLIDWLTSVYDRSLQAQRGGEWYAGRTPAEMVNTYEFVRSQTDLLDTYLQQVRRNGESDGLRYGLAAAMSMRFTQKQTRSFRGYTHLSEDQLLDEMGRAGHDARLEGKVFSGCGITSLPMGVQATEGELNALGYGNKEESDKFGSLKFKCKYGHQNKRPRAKSSKDFLSHCKTCGVSVKC